ncbi:hypothetical protein AB3456_08935 [Staphylococcus pseudoxylosus]|uniref:hypothetical protein n=1 Tax=Staphylococcus pseudoxylosus TaxID=2282419 RepID=UPI0034D29F0B
MELFIGEIFDNNKKTNSLRVYLSDNRNYLIQETDIDSEDEELIFLKPNSASGAKEIIINKKHITSIEIF